jgi:hypothetical protein
MTNKNEIKESDPEWPDSFEDVEDGHLKQMLKMALAQRLALAEELLEFAVIAGVVNDKGSDHL